MPIDRFETFRVSLLPKNQGHLYAADITKEAFLRSVFSGKWVFTHYNDQFHYVPEPNWPNPDVLAGRIGRPVTIDENLGPDKSLQPASHDTWKAAVLVIDPREHEDGQKIFMNYDTLVGKPIALLNTLVALLNAEPSHQFHVSIEPIFDGESFWSFAERYKGEITTLTFDLTAPNMFETEEELNKEMQSFRDAEGAHRVAIKLSSSDGLKTDTTTVKQGVHYAEKGAGEIRARTKQGRAYSSKKRRPRTVTLDKAAESTPLIQKVIQQIKKLVPK